MVYWAAYCCFFKNLFQGWKLDYWKVESRMDGCKCQGYIVFLCASANALVDIYVGTAPIRCEG